MVPLIKHAILSLWIESLALIIILLEIFLTLFRSVPLCPIKFYQFYIYCTYCSTLFNPSLSTHEIWRVDVYSTELLWWSCLLLLESPSVRPTTPAVISIVAAVAGLWCSWDRIFKRLWSPGVDSREWIPPAYVAWRPGTITLFLLSSYSPHRLFKNSSSGISAVAGVPSNASTPAVASDSIAVISPCVPGILLLLACLVLLGPLMLLESLLLLVRDVLGILLFTAFLLLLTPPLLLALLLLLLVCNAPDVSGGAGRSND